MANKSDLEWGLRKDNSTLKLTASGVCISDTTNVNSIVGYREKQLVIQTYNYFIGKKEELLQNSLKKDFVYLSPIYVYSAAETKFPSFATARYKTLIPNMARYFLIRNYRYYPATLYWTGECFIGNRIILDKNFKIIVALSGDIKKTEDDAIFVTATSCKIDSKVFKEKSQVYNFVKNTLLPMLIEKGYSIEIDDFSSIKIFETPVPPTSFDFEKGVEETLLNNIDKL